MRDFKTFEEQINILKSRGLIINDEEVAKDILAFVNYYNLINGYKYLFINIDSATNTETFKQGVSFEDIYHLYFFDRELRSIFFKFILKLENALRTQISYVFSKHHNSDNYLIYENFETFSNVPTAPRKTKSNRARDIFDLISTIQKEISKGISKKTYISHYIAKDGTIPLWVLVNSLTFGTLSKFYSVMNQAERVEVSKYWGSVQEKDLKGYIKALANLRNLCAHDERIYCVELGDIIPTTSLHGQFSNLTTQGKKDLFSIVIIFKILLKADDFKNFYNLMNGQICSLKTKITSIPFTDILDYMGFPAGWENIKKI